MTKKRKGWRLVGAAVAVVGAIAAATVVAVGTAHAATACGVSYELRSEWAGGFLTKATIENQGATALTDWEFTYTYPGDQRLTSATNATIEQPDGSREVTLRPRVPIATVAPGGEVTMDLVGRFVTDNTYPTGFTVDGVACTLDPPTVLTPASVVAVREGGTAQFTVALTGPPPVSWVVTVEATSGDPDILFSDGTPLKALNFTSNNWKVPQVLRVSARHDLDYASGTTTFTVLGHAPHQPSTTLSLRELDDDDPTAPKLIVNPQPGGPLVAEGRTASFLVRLSSRPAAPVQVTTARSAGDPNIMVISGGILTLNADNWSTPHRITLAATEDADRIAGKATITIVAPGGTPQQDLIWIEVDND